MAIIDNNQDNSPKRAFIYCRTSEDTEEMTLEGGKVSIEEQEETCRDLAASMGYEIIDVFRERKRKSWTYPSGHDFSDDFDVIQRLEETRLPPREKTRDLLAQLLKRLPEVQAVFVRNPDRLVRSFILSNLDNLILNEFRRRNVVIISKDQSIIDPHNRERLMVFKMISSVTAQDLRGKADATKRGLRTAMNAGRPWFCPTFYGFIRDQDNRVVAHPKECDAIRDMFTSFVGGESINAIARRLNAANVPPPMRRGYIDPETKTRKRGLWEHSMLLAILRRPQYAGFQYQDDGVTEVKTVLYQPPVVDRELYMTAKRQLDVNRATIHESGCKNPHTLSGFLVCAYCQKHLYVTSTYKERHGKKFRLDYFRCMTHGKTGNSPQCKGNAIRENLPEGIENDDAGPYAKGIEDCLLPLLYKGYIIYLARQQDRPELQLEVEDCRRRKLIGERELEDLIKKTIAGRYSQEMAERLRPQLEEHCQELNQKLAALEVEANRLDGRSIPKMTFDAYPGRGIAVAVKRQLFAEVIRKVVVAKEQIEVILKDGRSFVLKRVLTRSGNRDLPKWDIVPWNSGKPEPDEERILVSTGRNPITAKTKFGVSYAYPNGTVHDEVYKNGNLAVWTVRSTELVDAEAASAAAIALVDTATTS